MPKIRYPQASLPHLCNIMQIPSILQSYTIDKTAIEIYVPQPTFVQQFYQSNKGDAYWAQVWPASIGLCLFLYQYPEYITGKTVLELAAGIGLPGLFAAKKAKQVTITDRALFAEAFVAASAAHLQLSNVTAATLNWTEAPRTTLTDVILLSDVNYEPAVFEELQKVIDIFLTRHVTVIISTPQRLVAKQFISRLLPYVTQQWYTPVEHNNRETGISIFVLQKIMHPSLS